MIAAIVLASGSGVRLGGETPKQFVRLADKPVFLYSLETFDRHPGIDRLVLVCHPDWVDRVGDDLAGLRSPIRVVAGGETRMDSGWNGLQALEHDTDYVLIHDAARPFVRAETVSLLIESVKEHKAVVPAIESADSLVEVEGGVVRAMPNRERFRRVQTPQAFAYALIVEAFRRAKTDQFDATTDDSRLVHRIGHPVAWVAGSESAFKITTAADLAAAERFVKG